MSNNVNRQRGNVLVGIIIGVVIGLAAALAVAVYVTKVPVPFMNKGQGRTAEQDAAESRKNQDWDPERAAVRQEPGQAAAARARHPAAVGARRRRRSPAGVRTRPSRARPAVARRRPMPGRPLGRSAGRPGRGRRPAAAAPTPSCTSCRPAPSARPEDAEAQRAKLSLMGVEAKVTEREQSGRTVYRVRVGPFDKKDDADRSKDKLDAGGLETALVRVQR